MAQASSSSPPSHLAPGTNSRPSLSRTMSSASAVSSTGGGGGWTPADGLSRSSSPGPGLDSASSSQLLSRRSSARSSIDGVDLTSTLEGTNGSTSNLGLPLSDLYETYFSPHLDLLDRKLRRVKDGIKRRAKRLAQDELITKAKSREEVRAMRNELRRVRGKVLVRMEKLQSSWRDAKNVRLREKISFVVGMMNLVVSSLLFALRPEWIPMAYTIQSAYFFPIRIYSYVKLKWHLFLFDYCYFANVLNLIYLWILPDSDLLFTICFCAAHGPLCISIATWRNSYVPHSIDRMTSLFLHLYPLYTFVAIRHAIPSSISHAAFPALQRLPRLDSWTALALNIAAYSLWQFSYYSGVVVPKRKKIASGERINSYSTLSSGKGAIAKTLRLAPEPVREPAFMLLQAVYTVVCTLPAPYFYQSRKGSYVLLLCMLTLSIWNGASFYLDFFARRFEKELLALRAELEKAKAYSEALDEDGISTSGGAGGGGGASSAAASNAGDAEGEEGEGEGEEEEGEEVVEEVDGVKGSSAAEVKKPK